MKKVSTGITKAITPNIGKELLRAGVEANRETLQKTVVSKVQDFLMQLQKQRDYRDQCEKNIALLEEKVAAIERGEITISNYGQITFHDAKLGAALVEMVECVNCGYRIRGKVAVTDLAITEFR